MGKECRGRPSEMVLRCLKHNAERIEVVGLKLMLQQTQQTPEFYLQVAWFSISSHKKDKE